MAKQRNAKILLRIDDLDNARKRSEYVEDIFRCLDWLGLTYDEGPNGPDDFEQNYSQRHRADLYQAGLESLVRSGIVFGCICSRATMQQSPDGLHPVSCVNASISLEQEDIAWRVSTTPHTIRWVDLDNLSREVDLHHVMRDFIVRRKDAIPAYQLASIIDDDHFEVDMIVRGLDLVESTAAQIWLSRQLGTSAFCESSFLHHELVVSAAGTKLSKSAGATSLAVMREESASPAKLFQRLSPLLGLAEPVNSLEEALSVWLEQE